MTPGSVLARGTALLALVALLVGVPVLLVALVGNPIPDGGLQALSGPIGNQIVYQALAVIGWVFWAQLALSTLTELIGHHRGRELALLPGLGLGPAPQVARILVGAVLAAGAGSGLSATLAPPPAAATPAVTTHTTSTGPGRTPEPAAAAAGRKHAGAAHGQHSTRQVSVRPGDSLWSIAEEHLGSGSRWREIADLNEGHQMSDGSVFRSVGLIQPGWTLHLPTAAQSTDRGPAAAHTYTVHPGQMLSGIAQDQLGNAERYPEIYTASQGITEPGGQHLTDPDHIEPGWTLSIPAEGGTHPRAGHQPDRAPAPAAKAPHTAASAKLHESVRPGSKDHAPNQDRSNRDRSNRSPDAAPAEPPHQRGGAPAGSASQQRGDTNTNTNPVRLQAPGPAASTTEHTPGWMVPGLAGAGVVLGAALAFALRSRRRTQFRSRRPGKLIAPPAGELAGIERSMLVAAATPQAATVRFMDAALRDLGAVRSGAGKPMPKVAAVELTEDLVVLHLVSPCSLAAPWRGDDEQLRWSLSTSEEITTAVAAADSGTGSAGGTVLNDVPAPYPLLVTAGQTAQGETWLLNAEALGILRLSGDPARRVAFARYVAAEVALNPWAHGARVDCVGLASEIAPMNPDRVTFHPTLADAHDAMVAVGREIDQTLERVEDHHLPDAATGRSGHVAEETWRARMVLLDAGSETDGADIAAVLDQVTAHPGRTSAAVLIETPQASDNGVQIAISAEGVLSMPGIGLSLQAAGLTGDEATGMGRLLAQSEDLTNVAVPRDTRAEHGWRTWADTAGALLPEHTLPRAQPPTDGQGPSEQAASVLEHADQHYLNEAATTVEELQTLAPRVAPSVRAGVESSDPTLDEDKAAWWSEDCDRPRLTLLGEVAARVHGRALPSRRPYFTSILAYLALHPHGVKSEQLADAFGVTNGTARNYLRTLRDWVGPNPRTGTDHVPDASKTRAAALRGGNYYQVDDLLVDADLFCRLRARGMTRGDEGGQDLLAALRLVSGPPFRHLHEDNWLANGERHEHRLVAMVVDVAHTLTTRALADGDLDLARQAAEIAILAGPHEEIARLNLAAVTKVEGRQDEARRMLHDEVVNRAEDDGMAPVELSERTQEVLAQWRAS